MISLSRRLTLSNLGFYLLVTLTLLSTYPCRADTAAPVPAEFQDLYTTLKGDLDSFNLTLHSQWNGTGYPVLFTANLWNANANGGPQLVTGAGLVSIQQQMQQLKAMGFRGVTVAVGFPMLYEPFFSSHAQYQQFVAFYQNVAASARALGLKVIVDNECLRNGQVLSGWDTDSFYASLTWDQYQQARAQTAVVIAQTMRPDYMVVLQEPDTEAMMTGQSSINTVSGSTSMLGQILASMQQSGVSGVQIGAGVGNWLPQYQQFIQSYVAFPLDFIDVHVLPVNKAFLSNALTIAQLAAAAGKPLTMTQTWLRKVRDSELTTLTPDQLLSRDPFSFWAPLDTYFLQTMANLAYSTRMTFSSAVEPVFFWSYLPYDNTTEFLAPSDMMNQATQQAGQSMNAAQFTSTALSYYQAILPAADTAPPSVPTNLAGVSGQPTQTYLTWNSSTDNVGVAGYYILRNGARVGATAQTFYVDTGLTEASTYTYVVEAFDLAGNLSTPTLRIPVTTWDTTPPTAPQSIAATPGSCQKISLNWSASTDKVGIAFYRIYRGTFPGGLTQVATTYGTSGSYMSYPLTPATTYYFAVQAVDNDGNASPASGIAAATTFALPSAPGNLVAVPLSSAVISLSWSAGPSGMGVAGYKIFRGTTPSSLVLITNRGSAATFYDYPLAPGTAFYYSVQAVDQGGNLSPMSAVATARTPPQR